MATAALVEGVGRIEGAQVWTKQGNVTVAAKVTIDASGDADLVAMAGLASFVGDNGRVQNPTMIFRLQGVDVERFLSAHGRDTIMPSAITEQIIAANDSGKYKLPRAKIWMFPTTRPNELLCNCTRLTGASIARSPWPIELHARAKPKVEWILDDYYDVPYGCFVPKESENLLVAGRCLSAEHDAVASARVTAQCFSYGHAIGHAAAIALRDRISVRSVEPGRIREELNREGARLE